MTATPFTQRISAQLTALFVAGQLCVSSVAPAFAHDLDEPSLNVSIVLHGIYRPENGTGIMAETAMPSATPDTRTLRRLLAAEDMPPAARYRLERLLLQMTGEVG